MFPYIRSEIIPAYADAPLCEFADPHREALLNATELTGGGRRFATCNQSARRSCIIGSCFPAAPRQGPVGVALRDRGETGLNLFCEANRWLDCLSPDPTRVGGAIREMRDILAEAEEPGDNLAASLRWHDARISELAARLPEDISALLSGLDPTRVALRWHGARLYDLAHEEEPALIVQSGPAFQRQAPLHPAT